MVVKNSLWNGICLAFLLLRFGQALQDHSQTLPPFFFTVLSQSLEKEGSRVKILSDMAETGEPACIWLTVSEGGLVYLKDVLLKEVLLSITPLRLPDIRKKVRVPFVGEVDTALTNVTLRQAEVPESSFRLDNSSITVTGSEVQVNMTLQWQYKYYAGWIPVPISDKGTAIIKISRAKSGASVNLEERDGGLSVRVLQCGTHINDVEVTLHGGTSWLYQWMVDAFEERIRSTVENQLNVQIRKGFKKLDTLLLELPRKVIIDETTMLDFTILQAPIFSPTSVSIGIKGLFESANSSQGIPSKIAGLPPGLVCSSNMKMLTIALSDSVLNSAAAVYYNADLLNSLIDKIPDQSYRNTAKWKFIAPRLYTQYPNEEIKLVFNVSSTPNIRVSSKGILGIATASMRIDVLDKNATVSVASISITFNLSGIADISGNNITAQVRLNDITLKQEWSNVGDFRLKLVKIILRAALRDVALPLLNLVLKRGFPLPIIPSVELRRADVNYGNGYILVCTDVEYVATS